VAAVCRLLAKVVAALEVGGGQADLADPAAQVTEDRAGLATEDPADPADPATEDPADPATEDPADPADPATEDPADPADPATEDPADQATEDPADPATSVDLMTVVVLATSAGPAVLVTSGRDLGTLSEASVAPRGVMDQRRGVGEHLPGPAGAGRSLRRGESGTKGRSITGATTSNRYGIRVKTAGGSTSSESGSRCNESLPVGRPPAGLRAAALGGVAASWPGWNGEVVDDVGSDLGRCEVGLDPVGDVGVLVAAGA
jgi:hypothetical protein